MVEGLIKSSDKIKVADAIEETRGYDVFSWTFLLAESITKK